MYPIKFENIYYEKIWGGRDFDSFRENLPSGNIGESWDVACHKNGTSVVANGKFKGQKFDDLIKEFGDGLVGTRIDKENFPLLVKLINAKENLSIQVHPNDDYGYRVENEAGKTEAWYVVDAYEGANLVIGTLKCSKEEFKGAIINGICEEYLNRIPVKKGDVFFVKSGLVHAIGEGVVIAEIQQNSDTTYRVFDYNRGRELHVDKAMDCIDFSLQGNVSKGLIVKEKGYEKKYLNLCDYFSLEKYNVFTSCSESSDVERFFIFTCVDGQGVIKSKDSVLDIKKGDSIFIPATLGEYVLEGRMELLKSYVPNMQKTQNEILETVIR